MSRNWRRFWPRSFGAAGALHPLDELIGKTNIGIAGWDQYVARDMQRGPDGKIYAIPFTVDTFAMVYNTDLLKAGGYDEGGCHGRGTRRSSAMRRHEPIKRYETPRADQAL